MDKGMLKIERINYINQGRLPGHISVDLDSKMPVLSRKCMFEVFYMCTAMAVSLLMSRTDISFSIKLAYMRMCYLSQYKSAKELARRKWQRA